MQASVLLGQQLYLGVLALVSPHRRSVWTRALQMLCRAWACSSIGHSGHLALKTTSPVVLILQ